MHTTMLRFFNWVFFAFRRISTSVCQTERSTEDLYLYYGMNLWCTMCHKASFATFAVSTRPQVFVKFTKVQSSFQSRFTSSRFNFCCLGTIVFVFVLSRIWTQMSKLSKKRERINTRIIHIIGKIFSCCGCPLVVYPRALWPRRFIQQFDSLVHEQYCSNNFSVPLVKALCVLYPVLFRESDVYVQCVILFMKATSKHELNFVLTCLTFWFILFILLFYVFICFSLTDSFIF